MPSEPLWLSPENLIEINRTTVAQTGEPHFLINRYGLEIATYAPYHRFTYGETNTLRLAVNLLFSIARNHPFEQGNKRTAFIAALIFLEWNGYAFTAPDSIDLGRYIIAVLLGDFTEDDFLKSIEPYVVPI